ncbi:acyl carrier protein [Curtobacterium flaccumfaciens]|uniref:acyl carrier protein n=1 Tax=Curtobacterium flaccumfaciens TaxID=2035 RepID=UPI0019528C5A|nr:phosphopantetheine-binding protein [Curtobacterium flaccumfaciens]
MTNMATINDEDFERILRPHLKYLDSGEPVNPEVDLKSLGLDSMSAVDLLFDFEDEFGIVIPDEEMVDSTFATAGALREVVNRAEAIS